MAAHTSTPWIKRGFTLMELMITMGIMAILAAFVIAALGPTKILGKSIDSSSLHSAQQLQNSLLEYAIDHGTYPSITSVPEGESNAMPVCSQGVESASCINLSAVAPGYIVSIPTDKRSPCPDVLSGFKVYKRGNIEHVFPAYIGYSSGTIGVMDPACTVSLSPQLLDKVPGALAAYSLRKLASDYTGYAIQIRRTSDLATKDIGFTGKNLDVPSIISFLAPGESAMISRWYDQSGNGHDMSQPAYEKSPFIVVDGVLQTLHSKPAIQGGYLYVDTPLSSPVSGLTLATVGQQVENPSTSPSALHCWNRAYDAELQQYVPNYFPSSTGVLEDSFGSHVRRTTVNPDSSVWNNPFQYVVRASGSAWSQWLNGGIALFSDNENTLPFGSDIESLACIGTGGNAAGATIADYSGLLVEHIIWPSSLSTSDLNIIGDDQQAFWGLTWSSIP